MNSTKGQEEEFPFRRVDRGSLPEMPSEAVCSTIALNICTDSPSHAFHEKHYGNLLIAEDEMEEYLYWFGFQEAGENMDEPIEGFIHNHTDGVYCLAGWDPTGRNFHAVALLDGVLHGEYFPGGMRVSRVWEKVPEATSLVAESVADRLRRGIYVNFVYERMQEELEKQRKGG